MISGGTTGLTTWQVYKCLMHVIHVASSEFL